MKEENREVLSMVLHFLGFIAVLIFLYFAVCAPISARGETPEWRCWVNSVENAQCGTYGNSKDKSVAYKAAYDLCISECSSECKLEYCERVP